MQNCVIIIPQRMCCRGMDVHTLILVDTVLPELARPAQLANFVALQRLHLENIMEVLHCDWAIKVTGALPGVLASVHICGAIW